MNNINLKSIRVSAFVLLASLSSQAQISKAEIIATGLTCSMCSNAINKQLKKMTEVDSVTTDLNTNTFVVYLKEENNLSPRAFKESVEKAGFFVGSLEVTIKAEELKSNPNYISVETLALKNNDDAVVRILDKGYVTDKEYKKLLKTYSKSTTFTAENENNYHVKLVK